MKKYKFLFLVLLFGLFFIPKDVFAAEVPVKELILYNSSWHELDKCTLATENCSFAVSPVDGTVLYMRATFNYNFYVGNVYSLEWSFKTGSGSSYSFAPHQPNIGINGEYQDKTNTQWRQENEEIVNLNRFKTYYFFTDFTSKNTTSSSAYPPYVQAQISNPASTSFYFESLSLNVTNKGTDTSSIIQNSTQTIIDNQNKNQQQTNERLDSINNFLEDDSSPESDISTLGNVQGLLPPGPVDSLLNIPFKFLSIIVSSLGSLCVPMNISWVFNKTLSIPCFGDVFYDNVPSYLMIFINLIPSAFILINYLKYLYKKVERATSLETTTDDEWGVL